MGHVSEYSEVSEKNTNVQLWLILRLLGTVVPNDPVARRSN